ncbi:hypothetical protein L207DRAFT_641362 [Hyaloscypha variabilis F]|uniref:Uncharacterized protein n=1 Tax=Hyaloscypha variabilis (strain UAMH 11265 / GT02V1 / F) TaxID=1149755 RepID=A0A2J6QX10_HYAVF|nr:hypothetical protein L207DRAFT_641362 [Hyaloscypha variabilis F]
MESIYSSFMSGDSATKTHNRLSLLLGLQFFVMIPRTWVAFIQIIDLMFSHLNGFGVLAVFLNLIGNLVLVVLLLVEMHKRAVGTLSEEMFYKLQTGKTAWVVGGWIVLLGVYKGQLVEMDVLDWRVWSSLLVDLIYMTPFVGASVLVVKQRREEGITLL